MSLQQRRRQAQSNIGWHQPLQNRVPCCHLPSMDYSCVHEAALAFLRTLAPNRLSSTLSLTEHWNPGGHSVRHWAQDTVVTRLADLNGSESDSYVVLKSVNDPIGWHPLTQEHSTARFRATQQESGNQEEGVGAPTRRRQRLKPRGG